MKKIALKIINMQKISIQINCVHNIREMRNKFVFYLGNFKDMQMLQLLRPDY